MSGNGGASQMLYSSDGRMNTKIKRKMDITRSAKYSTQIPDSYVSNETKEELCLEYIKSFKEQFDNRSNMKINPKKKENVEQRMSPYLVAENEYGVNKMVCTTVRPTLMPIPELYDMHECASFLAGYIIYEPLDPPNCPPEYLFSPTQTLDSHTGDCFDISTLLCSFLLGSGYDAYIVCGYAPRFITLRDQSNTHCPMITKDSADQKQQQLDDLASAMGEASISSSTQYVPLDNTVKSSKFIADQAEIKRLAALDNFKLWVQDAELNEQKVMEEQRHSDEKGPKRMHAWVLVCAGRKDVKENIFLEPSTGRAYSWGSSPYIGIESVWNDQNYWVNNQPQKKIPEMNFDWKDELGWEQLFLAPGNNTAGSTEDQDRDDNDGDLMNDGGSGQAGEEKKEELETRYFDAPVTWVSPLTISRSRYLLKYPPMGKRSVQYYCAKADFFAKNVNSQSMVMRIILYLDRACTTVKEVHEWFESRCDKMYKRVRYVLDNRRIVEFYSPGSYGEMKKSTEYPGRSLEMDFHVDGRLDRLARRVEIIGERITEHFQGRTDLMSYRSIELTTDSKLAGSRQFILPGGTLASELFIVKMTQQFDKNVGVSNGTDIAKRVFYVPEGKAVFFYHFAKSQITGQVKTYLHTRGPLIPVISDFVLNQEIGLDDDPDTLQEAATIERECFSLIKGSFQQNERMQELRKQAERAVQVEKNVFEKAMDAVDKNSNFNTTSSIDSSVRGESQGTDYLTPFFRNVSDPMRVTKEEALEIRQSALDAMKARLVERANIIQTRLHDENAKLGRKQEQFQRSQREGDLSTEEYEKYCTEAMFRIQILEQRLSAHEESAMRKFAELDAKLSADPRLRVLKT